MHNDKITNKLTYYAYGLIFISIALLFCGLFLDFSNSRRVIDPIRDVLREKEINIISITTSDGSEIVPGNTIVNTENNTSEITQNDTNIDNNYTSVDESKKVSNLEYENNVLRNKIQNTYDVIVKYGNETKGYVVAGVNTEPIVDASVVNSQLVQLNNTLSLYPSGMFKEIKDGGIPLTIILINNYSQDNITGITDSSYDYAYISVAAIYPFGESFFHESYHYIERYLFKKGANFNSWDSLNPSNFKYGTVYNDMSYSNTFSETAAFVNNYAQTAAAEDRASTFEYMMADSKARCLNSGNVVWQKAKYMSRTIEVVLDTVSPDVVEYWERFL